MIELRVVKGSARVGSERLLGRMGVPRLSGRVAGSTALEATAAGWIREFRDAGTPLHQPPEDLSPEIHAAGTPGPKRCSVARPVAVGLMTPPGRRLLALDGFEPPSWVERCGNGRPFLSHQPEQQGWQDVPVSGLHRWTGGSNLRQPDVVQAG